ncbi:hypothetical protein [Sulfitobacter sp. 1A12157]|uniref:hypothetical protein n=1 Tax=Sulfitobacter sp. 1A12157 TaxID=3368594 RepID=UPI003746E86F
MDAVKIANQQLLSVLLRHGLRYESGKYWTQRHRRWLAELPVSALPISSWSLRNSSVPLTKPRNGLQLWIKR